MASHSRDTAVGLAELLPTRLEIDRAAIRRAANHASPSACMLLSARVVCADLSIYERPFVVHVTRSVHTDDRVDNDLAMVSRVSCRDFG